MAENNRRPWKSLILEVEDSCIRQDEHRVIVENPHLEPCWRVLGCHKKRCPVYGKPSTRCWQQVGTFCAGFDAGLSVSGKWRECRECEVFRRATPTQHWRMVEALSNIVHIRMGEATVREGAGQVALRRHWISKIAQTYELSSREIETVALLLRRHSRKEMAKILGVSQETVKMHASHVYRKTNVASRKELEKKLQKLIKHWQA